MRIATPEEELLWLQNAFVGKPINLIRRTTTVHGRDVAYYVEDLADRTYRDLMEEADIAGFSLCWALPNQEQITDVDHKRLTAEIVPDGDSFKVSAIIRG